MNEGINVVQHIRVGVPDCISVHPLIFGLTRYDTSDCVVLFDAPGILANALSRGDLDVALLPSIEYFRGAGTYFINDPALVANIRIGSSVLLANKPIESVKRIAVDEFSRSSIGATRIVLAETYGVVPDLCVFKNIRGDWRDEHDGVLLTGDLALDFFAERPGPDEMVYNVPAMWDQLTSLPLVLALWVYNDETLERRLTQLLVRSRNSGLENLALLAKDASAIRRHDGGVIHDYLISCWEYRLTETGIEGLKVLEDYALRYDLIRRHRLAEIATK